LEPRARRRPSRIPQGAAGEDDVLPLARKLVDFAREQHRALGIDAHEQFRWITLRRDEVTERLSRLLAASVSVDAEAAAELEHLRIDMLALDAAMGQRLRAQLADAAARRRNFGRVRKSLSSYLNAGPRRGFIDTQR